MSKVLKEEIYNGYKYYTFDVNKPTSVDDIWLISNGYIKMSSLLTGLNTTINAQITNADSLIIGMGKLQAQIDNIELIAGNQGVQGNIGIQGFQGVYGINGNQGIQGMNGIDGNQGVQGVIGFQGFFGFQGNLGFQGFQGSQGIIGVQGFQGFQGSQGVIGFQGNLGFQGFQGVQGVIGVQGRQGIIGLQGVQGFQGSQGFFGFQGNLGFQGVQGVIGVQGRQGFIGLQGVQGFQGRQGIIGFQGIQGVQGFQGVQGVQGFQGVQGVIGLQGFVGNQGFQGQRGSDGQGIVIAGSVNNYSELLSLSGLSAGDAYLNNADGKLYIYDGSNFPSNGNGIEFRGYQGNQGFVGNQGVQGFQGRQGVVGFQGSQGIQGFQGIQGIIGFQGNLGFQGNQGTQGFIGFQGYLGSQGNQGFVGNQGVQGRQGVVGFQGIIGVQGNQGTQGFIGFQGYLGSQGSQGVVGLQGMNGFQGNQGTQGFIGFQGVIGYQGVQGRQGVVGLQGIIGFQGNQGTQGFIGFQGRQGFNGINGVQGFQGSLGIGIQGVQGVSGSSITLQHTQIAVGNLSNQISSSPNLVYRTDNTLDVNGNVEATSYKVDGGNNNQFLKGDGSLDSNIYVTNTTYATYVNQGLMQIGWGLMDYSMGMVGVDMEYVRDSILEIEQDPWNVRLDKDKNEIYLKGEKAGNGDFESENIFASDISATVYSTTIVNSDLDIIIKGSNRYMAVYINDSISSPNEYYQNIRMKVFYDNSDSNTEWLSDNLSAQITLFTTDLSTDYCPQFGHAIRIIEINRYFIDFIIEFDLLLGGFTVPLTGGAKLNGSLGVYISTAIMVK